jgi:hypothetical protein
MIEQALNRRNITQAYHKVVSNKGSAGVDGMTVQELYKGIPTVLDRLLQQAVHQVIYPKFEIGFKTHSYGFRPKRNAHQAVLQAQKTLGIDHDHAYAWSRTRMGGWAVAQSPILGTTITLIRLAKRGYKSMLESYLKVSPQFNEPSRFDRDGIRGAPRQLMLAGPSTRLWAGFLILQEMSVISINFY